MRRQAAAALSGNGEASTSTNAVLRSETSLDADALGAVPITPKDPSGLLAPAASRLPGGTDKPLSSGGVCPVGGVPIAAKDPSGLLAPAASCLPGGTDKPLSSGGVCPVGGVQITAKDPDRYLTRVRRRVALWLPKGVGTFGRLKTGAPGRLCRMPPHDVR